MIPISFIGWTYALSAVILSVTYELSITLLLAKHIRSLGYPRHITRYYKSARDARSFPLSRIDCYCYASVCIRSTAKKKQPTNGRS